VVIPFVLPHALLNIGRIYLVVPRNDQLQRRRRQKEDKDDIPWDDVPEILVVDFGVRPFDGLVDGVVGELRKIVNGNFRTH